MNRILILTRGALSILGLLVLFAPQPGFPQTPKDSAPVFGFLRDVAVAALPQGLKVELVGDGLPPDFRNFTLVQPPRLVLDFPAVLSSFPKKFLEVDHPLLKDIRLGQHPDKLRLVLTFPGAGPPPYRLDREADRIKILIGKIDEDSRADKKAAAEEKKETEVPKAEPEKTALKKPAAPAPPARVPEERKPAIAPEKSEAEKPAVKIYTGEKITLDFIEADIRRVLALISEAAGRPIAPAPEVRGTVTLRLVDVPWDQALDAILSIFNLRRVDEGDLIRILPRSS